MVESEEKINYFIKSAIEFLRKYNFDGINLDWQFPTIGYGSKKEDMANYVKLTQVLRITIHLFIYYNFNYDLNSFNYLIKLLICNRRT